MTISINFYDQNRQKFHPRNRVAKRTQPFKDFVTLVVNERFGKAVGKVLLPIVIILLAIGLTLGNAIRSTNSSIEQLDVELHALSVQNDQLKEKVEQVTSDANVERMAGEKLSLFSASREQRRWYDKNKGTFVYL